MMGYSVDGELKSLTFTVHGLAQPAGSKQSFVPRGKDGKPFYRSNGTIIANTVDANKKSKPWKHEVSAAAAKAMDGRPLLKGPLRLIVRFTMPRPKGHFGSGKNATKLKPSAPTFHTVKPDVTKLVRGVEDALTKVVWDDDSQVAETLQSKVYGDAASVTVTIEELNEDRELPASRSGNVSRSAAKMEQAGVKSLFG